jgi:hypothetical protein
MAVIVVVALSCSVAGGEFSKETEIVEGTDSEELPVPPPHPPRVTIPAIHASRNIFSFIVFALGHICCRRTVEKSA